MNQYRPAHRSYNEKELRALIQRATELHEEASGGSERHLTLEEVEHIAAELGLPPEYLRMAALELENQPNADKKPSLWGAPFVIDQVRVVDETMTQEQWEQVVMEIRAFTGKKGQIDEVGSAREWMHAFGEGDEGINFVKTRVAIRPGDGQTSIQIRKHYGGIAIPAYVGALLVSTLLMFVTIEAFEGMGLPNLVNFALLGGAGIGALALVRGSLSLWARRQKERLKRLANLLHQTLSSTPPEALENEPVVELIELPERDESEHVSTDARQRMRT